MGGGFLFPLFRMKGGTGTTTNDDRVNRDAFSLNLLEGIEKGNNSNNTSVEKK